MGNFRDNRELYRFGWYSTYLLCDVMIITFIFKYFHLFSVRKFIFTLKHSFTTCLFLFSIFYIIGAYLTKFTLELVSELFCGIYSMLMYIISPGNVFVSANYTIKIAQSANNKKTNKENCIRNMHRKLIQSCINILLLGHP